MEYFIKCEFIDLETTFNCGQCFRWQRHDMTHQNGSYSGYAGNKRAVIRQEKSGLTMFNIKESDIPFWKSYFCIDEDYSSLIKRFSEDPTLKKACKFAPGIRVLRQQPFETLISFIISQNNNIKRITGIIEKMCSIFGENNVFPTQAAIARLNTDDLTAIGTGYRARYILDAANKINSGKINLDEIQKMPYNIAREELMKIVGVGEKVADCILLFGFHKTEAFPKDVWIKRVIAEYYPNGLPNCTKGYEGIAQQFLFHYIRNKQ